MTMNDDISTGVRRIGAEIAGPCSGDVDNRSRFPVEAINALKDIQALSAGIPESLGGAGLSIVAQGKLVRSLAMHCASTAMVLGMHYIKLASIVHFGVGDENFEDYMRSVVTRQRLVGSVTSEEGVGGNLRNSIAAIEPDGQRFKLVKRSTCLSYGAQADDLLITCRQDENAPASTQVVVLAEKGDFSLEQTGEWDAMGMRGTCSPPFIVSVHADNWHIMENSFADIAARTMVPDTHYIWSNVWLGIALAAAAKARAYVQKNARKKPSVLPDNAKELAKLEMQLERFKDTVNSVGDRYLRAHIADDIDYLSSISFSLKINALKLNASELVVEICNRAMKICGFAGYLNNSPYCIARHLRDALSAAPMIGNGRIIETNATHLLAHKGTDLMP